MADREREKKKKRAYLDDFEKDLNGNYQYLSLIHISEPTRPY